MGHKTWACKGDLKGDTCRGLQAFVDEGEAMFCAWDNELFSQEDGP